MDEGEWSARKHGSPKRRIWRKIHIGIDEETLEVRAVEVTTSNIGDAPMLVGWAVPLSQRWPHRDGQQCGGTNNPPHRTATKERSLRRSRRRRPALGYDCVTYRDMQIE